MSTYRYLAGYRYGDRQVGEKRHAYGHHSNRVRHHFVDNGAGRMYWCGCMKGFRIAGQPVWPSGPTRTRTFTHHHGSNFHYVRWQRREVAKAFGIPARLISAGPRLLDR